MLQWWWGSRIHLYQEKFMNLMKSGWAVWHMKKIIKDGNSPGWNYLLPRGYKPFQECETRFGTYYQVSARFLKLVHYIDDMSDSNLDNKSQDAYASLKKIKHWRNHYIISRFRSCFRCIWSISWFHWTIRNFLKAYYEYYSSNSLSHATKATWHIQWKKGLAWWRTTDVAAMNLFSGIIPFLAHQAPQKTVGPSFVVGRMLVKLIVPRNGVYWRQSEALRPLAQSRRICPEISTEI